MRKFFFITVLFLLSGCGPGLKDGETHIGGGYYFSFMGGGVNVINYEGDKRKSGILIDASVKQFFLYKDVVYLSRKPFFYKNEGDIIRKIGEGPCEYWTINIKTHELVGAILEDDVRNNYAWIKLSSSSGADELKERGLKCPLV